MLDELLDAGIPLSLHVELGQPGGGARTADPRRGWPARTSRSCPSSAGARRATARGGTSRGTETGTCCCARRRRRPKRTRRAFEDIERHRFFNTNNLWVDARVLKERVRAPRRCARPADDPQSQDGRSARPVVARRVSAGDGHGCGVGGVRRSPRSGGAARRFTPVKTTNDLLGLRSDAYVMDARRQVVVSPERTRGPLLVDLDPDCYRLLPGFEERFPQGAPSLVDCDRLDGARRRGVRPRRGRSRAGGDRPLGRGSHAHRGRRRARGLSAVRRAGPGVCSRTGQSDR